MKDYGRRFSIKLLENCENVEKCLDLFIHLFIYLGRLPVKLQVR